LPKIFDRGAKSALGSEWRGGIVVTRGTQIERLDETGNIGSVPVHRLLA